MLNDKQLAVPSNYTFIDGAEKVDDLHVRIKLKRVFPAALEYFSMVLPIYPKAYRERVGGEFSKQPVGTGPYKVTKVDGVTEIDIERNDDYFDGPKGKPADQAPRDQGGGGRDRRADRKCSAARPTGSGTTAPTRWPSSARCRTCR